MAFGFFRRRQKMVIIIMAVLMVSFLISQRSIESLLRKEPGKSSLGRTKAGKLVVGERWAAASELDVLRSYVGLGNIRRAVFAPAPGDTEFLHIYNNGDNADLAYALLLLEAREAHVEVADADVDDYLGQVGLAGAAYRGLISQFSSRGDMSEGRFRQVIARWLTVIRLFAEAQVASPPSEPELRRVFRDLNEKISLRVLKVRAEDFMESLRGATRPTEEDIRRQLDRFRPFVPGRYDDPGSFGFGYRQPSRVRIAYMLLRQDVVERFARPDEKAVMDYFLDHRDEFVRTIVEGSSGPASSGSASEPAASGPASATAEAGRPAAATDRTVLMTFAEARQQVIQKLTGPAVQERMDQLVQMAELELAKPDVEGEAGPSNAYATVKARMTGAADEVLAKPISVTIDKQRLDAAVANLAEAAGLSAICYPWDAGGGVSIDPAVRVSLPGGKPTTLGEALEEITRQITEPGKSPGTTATTEPTRSGPLIEWATCEGTGRVLFAVGGRAGLEFFPISVDQTDPLDARQVADHPVLGNSFTAVRRGQPLAEVAFRAQSLVAGTRTSPLIKVGEDGPRMQVSGDRPGRLIWRLIDAEPGHDPEQPTPRILNQIVDDLTLIRAMAMAADRARQIEAEAKKVGLEAAAKQAGMQTTVTGMTTREQLAWAIPVRIAWCEVSGLEMPTEPLRAYLLEKAFSLAPENVEPPYPADPPAVTVISLPARKEVVVLQRVDYRPAVSAEFEKPAEGQMGRAEIAAFLQNTRLWEAAEAYFNLRNIGPRKAFQPEQSQ